MAIDNTELKSLLKRISEGDKAAFSDFYDVTVGRAFGVILKMTANRELAEEIASDTYMQVWRSAEKYNADLAAPLTWVIMIARSRAIDTLRREKSATRNQFPLIDEYDAPDESDTGPLAETLNIEKNQNVKELLEFLNDSERQMITLAFYRGMSHNEIAAYTGKPLGSVKTILRRAQSILRSAWQKTQFLSLVSAESA